MSQLDENQKSNSARQQSQCLDPEMQSPAISSSERVNAPAIGILVISVIGTLFAAIGLLLNLPGVRMGAVGSLGSEQNLQQIEVPIGEGVFGILQPAVGLVVGVFCIIGARKMRNLERYRLSVAASILIMIPCHSLFYLLGLPIGIWALIVLKDPRVRSTFQS